MPLVTWRPREYSGLADALCNHCMNEKASFDDVDTGALVYATLKHGVLQYHSDGGCRAETCGAHAFSICAWSLEDEIWSRQPVARVGFFVDADATSFGMELQALAASTRMMRLLCERLF